MDFPKKVLVTGGAGFIGSFLVEALLAKHCHVVAADNFSTGCRANLDAVAHHPALEIVELDVTRDAAQLAALVKDADAVVHLAAAVGVELIVDDPVRSITTNVRGTENLLGAAAQYGKRTIIASTSEVYGKSGNDLFAEYDDLVLGSPYFSRWSYACGKLLDEFLLMALCQKQRFPGTIVRFFNTVGPRQTGRYGMVLPRFVAAALQNAPLRVFGDGKQSRCFCHVCDVVRALLLLLAEEKSFGNIYNIGSTELITIGDLARRVIDRTHSRSAIEIIPYCEAYPAGFEDMRRRKPDTSAVTALTGWQVEHDLDDVIDDIVASFSAGTGKKESGN